MPRSDEAVDAPGIATLTGVRSGKKSYYVELRRSEERMTSAVHALEGISAALVRSRADPRELLREVLTAASGHLDADWTLLALRSAALPTMPIRALALGPDHVLVDDETAWPSWVHDEIDEARSSSDPLPLTVGPFVRVPMELDGQLVGRLVVRPAPGSPLDHADHWVLTILANQAATSMHTATLYTTASDLRAQAQDLYDQVAVNSRDLEVRTAELQQAEGALRLLHDRELLDGERHRIALELHDSVAQHVLSAGLAVDVCRAEAADALDSGTVQRSGVERLTHARDLIAQAGEQVRSVIYALHHESTDDDGLATLLEGLAAQHRVAMDVAVRIEGRPVPLGAKLERALARSAGEALFNVSIHAHATRVIVRLQYRPDRVSLFVSDDGEGDPADLRRRLRVSARGDSDGRHQGLATMARRSTDIGGTFTIRRSKLGGIRVELRVPMASVEAP